jgi:hypothetical protein
MTRALRSRLRRLEHSKTAGGVRVVIQPAGLEGEALSEWRRANLPAGQITDAGDTPQQSNRLPKRVEITVHFDVAIGSCAPDRRGVSGRLSPGHQTPRIPPSASLLAGCILYREPELAH